MKQHKPVAWRRVIGNVTKHYEYNEIGVGAPLYDLETVRQQQEQIKELKNAKDYWCLAYKDVLNNLESLVNQKALTNEEVSKLWAESHEDGIAVQKGFTTQQHYFAWLILRKAQENE